MVERLGSLGLPFNHSIPEMVKQAGCCWKGLLGNNVSSMLRKPTSYLGNFTSV